ncbi:MAG: uracil-xanthine permease family protein [Peptostreptococcaceae bacterium]|nr:uracil-xanthine permease family protein [Peptostreptococcaceae bacterium]
MAEKVIRSEAAWQQVKREEKSERLSGVQKILLALQHLLAMFGATVLVPMLTGLNVSVALVSAGVGTLVFHLCTKKKVPVFLGSSFAFIPVIIAVREAYGDLGYAQGGIIAAGFIYVLVSLIVSKVGVDKIKEFFPPQVIGPMIVVIGTNLIPVAFGMAKENYLLSAVTLGTALAITLFAKGFFKQTSIITGVFVGYALALYLGAVDTSIVGSADLLHVPDFTLPKFSFGAVAVIAPVVLAVFMEHIGDVTTNGMVVGKNFLEDPGLHRTLLGDGLATLFAGLIGGPANTTYGENTGVLALTKNYDPAILRITALLAIVLGFIGKVGGFLRTIPTAVMGGISLMLFSMIALIGVKTIRNAKTRMNVKNLFVIATVLFIGLSGHLNLQIGIPITENVSLSGLSLAAVAGVALNKLIYCTGKD